MTYVLIVVGVLSSFRAVATFQEFSSEFNCKTAMGLIVENVGKDHVFCVPK
jgi:hypothetical protein